MNAVLRIIKISGESTESLNEEEILAEIYPKVLVHWNLIKLKFNKLDTIDLNLT